MCSHIHTHITHLFVPETHLAGLLIVVFGSSPSDRHHMDLEKKKKKISMFLLMEIASDIYIKINGNNILALFTTRNCAITYI